MFDQLAAESPDHTVTIPFDMWCNNFINDAAPDLARSTYEELCAEGYDLMTEPVDLKRFPSLDIPISYINLADDVVFPSEWAWHPRLTSKLPFRRIIEMPGSHEVMYTNPEGLARTIIEASEGP